MIRCPTICVVLILVMRINSSQISESDDLSVENACNRKDTCSECITTSMCTWCMEPFMGSKPNCYNSSLNMAGYCKEEFQWSPDIEQYNWSNRKLTKVSFLERSGRQQDIVQIRPQRIGIKLRINEEYRLKIEYAQAEDFPLDLYFLMDLSKSMEIDKDKLTKLGDLFEHSIRNITSNFRLGFGSFVNIPKSAVTCENCEGAYTFKNHMSLSTDTTLFSEEIKKIAVSNASNTSEVDLGSLMQAIVCRNQIGWRENARRILVFSTNAGLHYAQDGIGDAQCHLNSFGLFIQTGDQYNPSVSQINSIVGQNKINVIFTVPNSQSQVYGNLSNYVEGSLVGILSENSANVLELVRNEYSKISSSVELRDTSTEAVKITYSSSCFNRWSTPTNQCHGLKVGDVVQFTPTILVESCPKNKQDWKQKFEIYPVGINQSLTVDLEMLCSCPCEQPHHRLFEFNSSQCNGVGSRKCGICECDELHHGSTCERSIRPKRNVWDDCPTCTDLCHELKDCVQCQIYKTGPLAATEELCVKNCTKVVITEVDIEALNHDKERGEHLCLFYDETDCRYQFIYSDLGELDVRARVKAQNKRECPTTCPFPKLSINYWALGLCVLIAVVLSGIGILLYRKL